MPAHVRRFVGVCLFVLSCLPAAAADWTWAGPDGGTVFALALQPGSSKVLYAGTASGVFKSADGGATWLPSGPGIPAGTVRDIAIDPAHPSTVYAGMTFLGIFKSTDGGAHWTDVGQGLPDPPSIGLSVHAVAVAAGGVVYAGTSLGVYRSHDGGATWQSLNQGLPELPEDRAVSALEIDPSRPERMYAGLFRGLYRSTDGGVHWTSAGESALANREVRDIEVSPASPKTVYASTSIGVFRSLDAGATWLGPGQGLQGNVKALAVHPTLPGTVYACSSEGVFKSADRGAFWIRVSQGLTDPNVLALAIHPSNPATLWAGTSSFSRLGGVFQTTDAGAHWTYRSRGLAAQSVSAFAIDPSTPGTLFAAIGNQGLFRSRDRGLHWTLLPLPQGLVITDIEVDPTNPSVVYATTGTGLFKSTDGGDSWNRLQTAPNNLLYELAIDPENPNVVYLGGSGLFKSVDAGATWTQKQLASSFAIPLQIEITPHALYVIAQVYEGPKLLRVQMFRSRDAGETWQILDVNGFPSRLAASPSDPETVYLVLADGILRTTDGGDTWQPVAGQLQSTVSLAIAPGPPETLYVSVSGKGVFKSTDGGATWNPAGEGLEGFSFTRFLIPDPHDEGRLYVGIGNRGIAVLFEPDGCVPEPATLCLQGRFHVEVAWADFQGNTGFGQVLPLTGETGGFWFFEPTNVELVVKVLDGRDTNGKFWVFYASLTSVEFTLTVTDTETGKQRIYRNPSGKMASFADTNAF